MKEIKSSSSIGLPMAATWAHDLADAAQKHHREWISMRWEPAQLERARINSYKSIWEGYRLPKQCLKRKKPWRREWNTLTKGNNGVGLERLKLYIAAHQVQPNGTISYLFNPLIHESASSWGRGWGGWHANKKSYIFQLFYLTNNICVVTPHCSLSHLAFHIWLFKI